MQLQFIGCGDAFGSGGRFNTCFRVTTSATNFLIDCGASSLVAMRKLGVDPNSIPTIFITHLHGDHFGGLPFFILDAQFASRRTVPLTIAGPPGLKARLEAAQEVLFPGSSALARKFEMTLVELEPGKSQIVNGIGVTPHLVKHECGAPPFALRLDADGKVVTYSGDTEWTDALVDAGKGADLFVCEAYFYEKSAWYHLDWTTLRSHLPKVKAKRIILTHFSADMLTHLDEIDFETADDGKVVEI
jgi:ribonuclease BN (tRNA processing enzyme)